MNVPLTCNKQHVACCHIYGDDHLEESLFIAFAKFEEGQKEHDRARVIYRYALDHMPKEKCLTLYNEYTRHEKKYGDKSSIDDVITSKRKFQYEEAVTANPHDYDTWFDYARMLEADGNVDLIRETYERAIACVPPLKVSVCIISTLFPSLAPECLLCIDGYCEI